MIDVGQNSILRNNMVHLPQLDDVGLLKSLHSGELARLLVLGQHDSSE